MFAASQPYRSFRKIEVYRPDRIVDLTFECGKMSFQSRRIAPDEWACKRLLSRTFGEIGDGALKKRK